MCLRSFVGKKSALTWNGSPMSCSVGRQAHRKPARTERTGTASNDPRRASIRPGCLFRSSVAASKKSPRTRCHFHRFVVRIAENQAIAFIGSLKPPVPSAGSFLISIASAGERASRSGLILSIRSEIVLGVRAMLPACRRTEEAPTEMVEPRTRKIRRISHTLDKLLISYPPLAFLAGSSADRLK